ncbi:acyl-CoA synthetase [Limibacillus sp. MBR-115]|jgi:fatty-acyl-CoA synthase|uniref:acyl-CoA synthetase n=1 Tax=Limibacillus sp. MBR-115 TaxID=3156465 RepID=UPI0033931696
MSAGPGESIFEQQLPQNSANFTALSPLSFLRRAAMIYPDKAAVIHGEITISYSEFEKRCIRLAAALKSRGIKRGDCVAVMAPNIPALLEAHYGVPMAGAVLNALNVRLDAQSIAFILEHGEAKLLIADREFSPVISKALALMSNPPAVVDIEDSHAEGGAPLSDVEYEEFLTEGATDAAFPLLESEWQGIALNYTSGTTGNPKGVVYHHRGAYLNAIGNLISFNLTSDTVYLWTLPMFHCNGWTYTWAVTAACGTHVCLRRVDPALIYPLIGKHKVTHMCGAPIVLTLLAHADESLKRLFSHNVKIATGGAAPPSAVIERMEEAGFNVLHLYGLTECYGPATLCAWQDNWNSLDLRGRSEKMARQGVKYVTLEDAQIRDPDTLEPTPWDGETIGELMLRGNTVMKGYLKNPSATEQALRGGWFHTGDLGVQHPDGYIEIKDRSKDIIISGGENISSLEVEEVLYRHPLVLEAAVVAQPDEKWGETPCAFVTLQTGAAATADDIIAFCRDHLARYKVPKSVVFGPLPKTSTGKIQKFELRERAAAL